MKAKKIAALCLAASMCFSMTGCQEEAEVAEVTSVLVEAATPEKGDLAITTTYMGSVAPEDEVMVYPLVSGTVTEANYQVGDYVEKGAVLFRIDDTAAQLQMSSATASYNSAEASINMATDSSRDLQNVQTEAQIDSLYSQLDTYEDAYDDAKDDIKDINKSLDSLKSASSYAKSAYETAQAEYAKAQAAYNEAQKDYTAAKTEYDKAKVAYAAALAGEDNDSKEGNVKAAKDALDEAEKNLNNIKETINIDLEKTNLDVAKANMEDAKTAYQQAASAVSSAESAKTQLKAVRDQADTAIEQLEDSIQTAEEAYAITKGQLYAQQDASYDAQLAAASLGIESAQTQLSYYTIKAPISGVIEAISVKENAMASAGYTAYIISNKDNMVVTFNVTEAAARELQVGDSIEAERNGKCYQGTITEVGVMASAQTKLFTVKASLGQTDDLSTGVSVKVRAESQKSSDVLKVPYDALYFKNGKAYVYCVADGKAVMTEVTTGLINDTEAEILSGIDSSSMVVTTWSSQLKDGVNVTIKGEETTETEEIQVQETETQQTDEGEVAE